MTINLTKEELLDAIKQIDENPNLKSGRHSSTYDLVYKNLKYPPILVLSLANEKKHGTELTLQDFGNNVEVPFKFLRDNDFEIVPKSSKSKINNKEDFKIWLLNNLAEKSGAIGSYIIAIDWLSERFNENNKITQKSIFEIEDLNIINQLYSEAKNKQKDKTSYIYNHNAPSYGDSHYYTASLKKYGDFLKWKLNNRPMKEKSFSEEIIYSNKSIREFAKYVFTFFYGDNLLEVINNSTNNKPSSINDTSYIFHDFKIFKRLIGEFNSPQSKESLTSSKTIRFFEEPIYSEGNKYFYFSTQWYGVGEHSLTFQNLKYFFEKEFSNYKLTEKNGVFFLHKSSTTDFDSFRIVAFIETLEKSGLYYSSSLITRFCASLITKPFLILTGLSGSGKTKIAQAFVHWICENDMQYKIVPVGADWTNREPLVGYPNGLLATEYITPDSGVIHLLMEAIEPKNKTKPYFLILDEMNLSHVERYFADFLSIMESNDTIKLYTGNKRKSIDGLEIPLEIGWPENLFIIGTVNIDETTYMFSPKVLDRANVIEFRLTDDDITNFLSGQQIPELKALKGQGIAMAESFKFMATKNSDVKNEYIAKELVSFFKLLKNVGAEFGYRSATEIMQLTSKLKILEPTLKDKESLDIAIMQKLLPKLHGSRSKLVKILIALSGLCVEGIATEEFEKKFEDYYKNNFEGLSIKYPISFEKLIRMYKNVLANGFTSYAEA